MLRSITIVAAALMTLGACSRTDDGRIVIERPGDVDVKTTKDTIGAPRLPSIGTETETLVVKKPVIRRDTTDTSRR